MTYFKNWLLTSLKSTHDLLSRAFVFGWVCCLALLPSFFPAAASAQRSRGPAAPEGAVLLVEGPLFPEGPLVDPQGTFFFSDVTGNKIYRWTGSELEVFADDTQGCNGLAMHRDGSIYACAGKAGAIFKFAPDGSRTVFVDKVGGLRLGAVNDLVFDAHGNLFFTSPTGLVGQVPEGVSPPSVVRARPDGSTEVVITGLSYPNGIGISPGGDTLYVNDTSGGGKTWRYPLDAQGGVGEGEVFVDHGGGSPDGMAVAKSGNVYMVQHGGSKVVKAGPAGAILSEFPFARFSGVTNVCFGGKDMSTLFITVGRKQRVYTLDVGEPGAKLFSHP